MDTLTSFRFFAALWVMVFHFSRKVVIDDATLAQFIDFGPRGVDFFFLLSGFVLTHVYRDQMLNGIFSMRGFWVRRFARLYPVYIVTMFCFVVLDLARYYWGSGNLHDFTIANILASVFMLNAWSLTDGLVFNGPSWSVSAEMFAYFLFPTLILIVRSQRLLIYLVVASVVAFVLVHWFSQATSQKLFIHFTWDFGVFRIIPAFIVGVFCRCFLPQVSVRASWWLGIIGTLVILFAAVSGYDSYWIFVGFAFLVFYGALQGEGVLSHPLLVYLGEISYSTYMIHYFVGFLWFNVVCKYLHEHGIVLNSALSMFLVIVLVIGLSSLSYEVLEKPGRKYLVRKFS